jgi:hypothetical protein
MMYLGFKAGFEQSLSMFWVFSVSTTLLTISVIFTKFGLLTLEKDLLQSAESWFLGMLAGVLLSVAGEFSVLSVFSLSQSRLMSSLAGQLPTQWDWFLNNIVNPINEEAFWGAGLPAFVTGIMTAMAASHPVFRPLRSPWVQTGVLLVVLPVSFALFHVGKLVFAFITAALAFRALLTVLLYGDRSFNLVPYVVVFPSFLVGVHMGNNVGSAGLVKSWSIITGYPIGWVTGGVLLVWTGAAVLGLGTDLSKL